MKTSPDVRACSRAWLAANPERARANALNYQRRLKLEALNAYGGPVCKYCGETDFTILQLDHVNGDGLVHRRSLGLHRNGHRPAGHPFYRAMKKLGWPNDPPLQVLCRPCNLRRRRLKAPR